MQLIAHHGVLRLWTKFGPGNICRDRKNLGDDDMYMAGVDGLERLEWFVQEQARRLNWLRRSELGELQVGAMRAWPRYKCLLEIYIERCAEAGRTPRIPVIERPIVIRGGKNGLRSQ